MTIPQQSPATEAARRVLARFAEAAGLPGGAVSADLVELDGGASTRTFFRVKLSPDRSIILMHVPGGSQELGNTEEDGGRWPFLEVRDLLAQRGIRVPELLHEACEDGVLVIEDLGDDTLANFLQRAPHSKQRVYQVAVCDLARAQRALSELPPDSIVGRRCFDRELLCSEIHHFREWGLEARGIELSAADRRTFDRAADWIADTIGQWPRGFVHRDYQSRNLMVHVDDDGEPALTWIDFQDAMLGPRTYDLVALLSDSYQTFSREFVEERLDDYADSLGLSAAERQRVGFEFDLVTVQRKLKDAGRFVFIDRVNKNPNFLKFVEPTIEKATDALARLEALDELTPLRQMLARLTR